MTRLISPDDPSWSPLGAPSTILDRLLAAVREGVALGVNRHLAQHPELLTYWGTTHEGNDDDKR